MFDFLFTGWFWGVILIMVATGLIIKSVFRVRFSLLLMAMVIVLIFFIVNLFGGSSSDSVTFIIAKKTIKINTISEINTYNNAFSNIIYDLTQLDAPAAEISGLEINNLMGKTQILINRSHRIKLETRSILSASKTPDNIKTIAGNHVYFTGRYSKANPHTVIQIKTIFGSTDIFEK
jgi:hypothetical protein